MVGQDVDAASESGDENIQAGVNDEHRVKCAGDDQEGKVRHIHNGRQQFTNETVGKHFLQPTCVQSSFVCNIVLMCMMYPSAGRGQG